MRKPAHAASIGQALAGLGGPAPEAEASATRRRILDGAAELFAERGFVGATTRELARAAGVTEKTLFAHFRSKVEIFVAALAPGLDGLMGSTALEGLQAQAGTRESVRDRLVAVLQDRFRFARRRPSVLKSVVQEALLSAHFREALARHWSEHLLPPLREAIAAGVAAGEIRDVDPDRVIRTVVSAALGYTLTRQVLGPRSSADDDDEAEAIVDLLLSGVAPS